MFECKLDAANFAACSTPVAFSGLAEGSHTFAVRAVDVAGNIDASPATRTWTVDTSVPNTTITSGPSVTSSRDVVFAFSASETGALFECRLDGAVFAACSSPRVSLGWPWDRTPSRCAPRTLRPTSMRPRRLARGWLMGWYLIRRLCRGRRGVWR